jgi:hypothetical protein
LATASFRVALALAAVMGLAGCATTREVFVFQTPPPAGVASVAQVPDEGNSPAMNAYLESALRSSGLTITAPLPAGTRTSHDVDAIVSYTDVWRWELVMRLQSLRVRLYDGRSGDLLVTGAWNDSPLHGFRDANQAVQDLVGEMVARLKKATPK